MAKVVRSEVVAKDSHPLSASPDKPPSSRPPPRAARDVIRMVTLTGNGGSIYFSLDDHGASWSSPRLSSAIDVSSDIASRQGHVYVTATSWRRKRRRPTVHKSATARELRLAGSLGKSPDRAARRGPQPTPTQSRRTIRMVGRAEPGIARSRLRDSTLRVSRYTFFPRHAVRATR